MSKQATHGSLMAWNSLGPAVPLTLSCAKGSQPCAPPLCLAMANPERKSIPVKFLRSLPTPPLYDFMWSFEGIIERSCSLQDGNAPGDPFAYCTCLGVEVRGGRN